MQDSINKIADNKWNLYIEAMDAQVQQDKNEQNKHIKQVTQQNANLDIGLSTAEEKWGACDAKQHDSLTW